MRAKLLTLIGILVVAGILSLASPAFAVTQYAVTVAPSGGDFTSLFSWNDIMKCDLTAASTVTFAYTGLTGTVAPGAWIKGASSAAYGQVIHRTATRVLVKSVSGTFTYTDDGWGTIITEVVNVTNGANGAIAGTGSFTTGSAQDTAFVTVAISGTWTSPDTTAVAIDGWTTSATNFISIWTDWATRQKGIWNTSTYYRLEVTATGNDQYALSVKEEYVTLCGLQVKLINSGNYTGCRALNVNPTATGSFTLNNSIIKGELSGTGEGIGLYLAGTNLTSKVHNNLIYGFVSSATANTAGITTGAGTHYLYNNTEDGNYIGLNATGGAGTVIAKNNLAYNNTTDYTGTTVYHANSTNNISKDATSPSTGYRTRTVAFVDEAAGNFKLTADDTGARNAGADLTADAAIPFAYDNASNGRMGGSWDIGAFEQGANVAISTNTTWTYTASRTYDDIYIYNNAVLTLQCDKTNGLGQTINAKNIKIESGASISSNVEGFAATTGTGKGTSAVNNTQGGSGGGHGGKGGIGIGTAAGIAYGSLKSPVTLGSPGGGDATLAGAGGGAVKFNVSETFTLNGAVTANGGTANNNSTYSGGGGSGGSIWIIANNIAGNGTIAANGGATVPNWKGGGGAGGRIAIEYTTKTFPTANITAYGGANGGTTSEIGGAGTIYLKSAAQTNGELFANNNAQAGAVTPLLTDNGGPTWQFDNFIGGITNGAHLSIPIGVEVVYAGESGTISGAGGIVTAASGSAITAANLTALTVAGTLNLNTGATFSAGALDSLTVSGLLNNYLAPHALTTLSVTGTINNYGTITYTPTSWTLPGTFVNQVGGGTFTASSLVDMAISGALTFSSTSVINVAALKNVTLSGTGSFTNGRTLPTLDTLAVPSGCTLNNSGTIPVSLTSWTIGGSVTSTGTLTASSLQTLTLTGVSAAAPSTLTLAGTYTFPETLSIAINDYGVLTQPAASTTNISLKVASMSIAANGAINLNSKGSGSYVGTGRGGGYGGSGHGGGAGHGGVGGNSSTSGVYGGVAYGSITNPVTVGSGGGYGGSGGVGSANGGPGGGAIKLEVSGTLTVNGSITADGGTGTQYISSGNYGGGGAGGSIWIICGSLAGSSASALITTNGGAGYAAGYAGGGGGGRIALEYSGENNYLGAMRAWGGAGGQTGGAGTIFTKAPGSTNGTLTVNNNAQNGAYTGLVAAGTYQFDNNLDGVTNGAGLQFVSGATFVIPASGSCTVAGKLDIVTGSTLSVPNATSVTLGGATTLSGTLSAPNATSLTIGANTTFANGSTLTLNASFNTLIVNAGATFTNYLTFPQLTTLTVNGAINNYGTISIAGLTSWTLPAGGSFTNNTGATFNAAALTSWIVNGTFSIGGTCTLPSSGMALTVGGTLTHAANTTTKVNYIDLTLTSLTINAGGSINATAKGFSTVNGTGYGRSGNSSSPSYYGGGAGYGGNGGIANAGVAGSYGGPGSAYGSLKQPTDLGSGGGLYNANANYPGGAGGGAIKLNVTGGTVTVNGSIVANGGSAVGGGGSGGSIWIICNLFQGTGVISAIGGNGANNGGGGGGGRIAVEYSTQTFFSNGTWDVYGGTGTGAQPGGGGTMYLKYPAQTYGNFYTENNSQNGAYTPLLTTGATGGNTWQFDNNSGGIYTASNVYIPSGITVVHTGTDGTFQSGAVVTNAGTILANSWTSLSISGTVVNAGTITAPALTSLTIPAGGALTLNTGAAFTTALTSISLTGTLTLPGAVSYPGVDMTINNGGVLTHPANSNTKAYYLDLTLKTLTVSTGGSINVAGRGYTANYGPGPGGINTKNSSMGAGGGHGGVGGNTSYNGYLGGGGIVNGVPTSPVNLGSGGGVAGAGGAGGGAVKISCSGTVVVNGSINTNGSNYAAAYGGGGAGGSVWIIAPALTGNGTIAANGGNGYPSYGGGGGGGRIMLDTPSYTFTNPSGITVTGGTTGLAGAAGTLYPQPTATIVVPAKGGRINSLPAITGTGMCLTGTLASPQVSIKNLTTGLWYSSASGAFDQATETWINCIGSLNWRYPAEGSSINSIWTSGTNYLVRTQVSNGTVTGTPYETYFYYDSVVPDAPTNFAFTATGGTIVVNALNATNTNFTASANMTSGQAVNGYAELLKDGVSFPTPIYNVISDKYMIYYTKNSGNAFWLAYKQGLDGNVPGTTNLGSEDLLYTGSTTDANNRAYLSYVLPLADGKYRVYYSYYNGTAWDFAYRDTVNTNPPSSINLGAITSLYIGTSSASGASFYTILKKSDNTYRIYYGYGTSFWQLAYRDTIDTNPPNASNLGSQVLMTLGSSSQNCMSPRVVPLSNGKYRLYYRFSTGTSPNLYYSIAYRDTTDTNIPSTTTTLDSTATPIGSYDLNNQGSDFDIVRLSNNRYRIYYSYWNGTFWGIYYKETSDTNPPNASNLGSPILLAGSTSDQVVSPVILKITDKTIRSVDTSISFNAGATTNEQVQAQFATTSGANLTVALRDMAGNTASAGPISVYANYVRPTVAVTVSRDPAPLGTLTLTCIFSKQMNMSVAPVVTYTPNGGSAQTCSGAWQNNTTYVATSTITTGMDGLAAISVSAGQDPGGNVMLEDVNYSFMIDSTAPQASTLVYTAGNNAAAETLTLTFSENLGHIGEAEDYAIAWDADNTPGGDRAVTGFTIAAGGSADQVAVTIPDQSQQTDATATGVFRVTITNSGNAADVQDVNTNKIDTADNHNIVTATLANNGNRFDNVAPQISSTSYAQGANQATELLTLSFNENIGDIGELRDYSVVWDADGVPGGDRDIADFTIAAGSSANQIAVTIPDQSQELDGSAEGLFRVTINNTGNEIDVMDVAGNKVDTNFNQGTASLSSYDNKFDNVGPQASSLSYALGTNALPETMTLTFNENIANIGEIQDYAVVWDADGVAGSDRAITGFTIAAGASPTQVTINIPDQSQQTDASIAGLLRVTVNNSGNDNDVKDIGGNKVDITHKQATVSLSSTDNRFDNVAPQMNAATAYSLGENANPEVFVLTFNENLGHIGEVQDYTVVWDDDGVLGDDRAITGFAIGAGGAANQVNVTIPDQSQEIDASTTGLFRVTVNNSGNNADVRDVNGNKLDTSYRNATVSLASSENKFDNVAPHVSNLNYTEGTNAEAETVVVNFNENLGNIGEAQDYSIVWDADAVEGGDRAITGFTIGAGSSLNQVNLTVPDQSQQLDANATGVFRVTVNNSGNNADVKDIAGNKLDVNYVQGTTTLTGGRFDTARPAIQSAAYNANNDVRTLTMTFAELIDISEINLSGLHIRPTGASTGGVDLTGATVSTATDSNTITLTTTHAQRVAIQALATRELDIDLGAFKDIAGNTNAATPNYALGYTPDTTLPVLTDLVANSINAANDTLVLTFSESMNTAGLTNDIIRAATNVKIYNATDASGQGSIEVAVANATVAWSSGDNGENSIATVTLSEALDTAYVPYLAASYKYPKVEILDAVFQDVNNNLMGASVFTGQTMIVGEAIPPELTIATTARDAGDEIRITSNEVLYNAGNAATNRANWTIYSDPDTNPLSGGESIIPLTNATLALSADKKIVTITLNPNQDTGAYLRNGEYIYVVPNQTNIRDLVGNASVTSVFTANPVNGDVTPPTVVSITGQSRHAAGDRIVLTFRESISTQTLTTANIAANLKIYQVSALGVQPTEDDLVPLTNASIAWTTGVYGTNSIATITLNKSLPERAYIKNNYYLIAEPQENGIRDVASNAMVSSRYFATAAVPRETTAPTVTMGTPLAGTRVGNSTVSYTLDETVGTGTISWGALSQTLTPEQCAQGPHDVVFGTALNSGSSYTVTVNVTDMVGNAGLAASQNVTYDVDNPVVQSVAIATSNGNSTRARASNTITYTFNYSEAVSVVRTVATRANNIQTAAAPDFPTSAGSRVSSSNIVFTVSDGDNGAVALNTINFRITDEAGNQATYANPASIPGLATVDGLITADTVRPTVSISNNLGASNITGEKAAGALILTLNFSEPMDQSVSPTVTYDPNGATGAQNCTGTWTNATTFVATNSSPITADTGDGIAAVSVTGARDLAANVMTDDTNDTFRISTCAFTITGFADAQGNLGITAAGQAQNLTVTVVDTQGVTRTGYTGTIAITSTDTNPNVVLPTTNLTFNAADAGVKTFSGVTLITTGTQTITVRDASNSSIVGTYTVTVRPGATNRYVLTPATATTTAGTRVAFTITRYDRFNNLQTVGASSFMTFSTTNAMLAKRSFQSQSGGTIGTINIPNGSSSANFWYYDELVSPTQWNVAVTDSTLNLQASSNVTVTQAPAGKYKVTSAESTMLAGGTLAITVTAYDRYDNLATLYGGEAPGTAKILTFAGANSSTDPVTSPTCNDSGANPISFGSPTSLVFIEGVSTTNMRLYKAETVAIKAAATAQGDDQAINTATTDDLEISVQGGSASKLSWFTQPNTKVVANAPWKAFSVSVSDAYGNVASGSADITVTPANMLVSPGATSTVPAVAGVATFANFRAYKANYNDGMLGSLTASATLGDGSTVSSSAAPADGVTMSEKYTITLNVKDSVTMGNLQKVKLSVFDANGALVDLVYQANPWTGNSPFSDQFYLPYGNYSFTIEKDEYVSKTQDVTASTTEDYASDGLYDNAITWNMTETSIAESMADYKVPTDFQYDETKDLLTVTQRLERKGQQKISDGINNLGTATIDIYEGPTLIGTLTNDSPDAVGNYWYSVAHATTIAPAGFTKPLSKGRSYFAKCKIGYGGVSGDVTVYASGTTFTITISEGLQAVTGQIATMSSDIRREVAGVQTKVAEEATATRAAVTTVKTETSQILTAASKTIPDSISSMSDEVQTKVETAMTASILNRDTEVMADTTVVIQYRTYPKVSPTITVYAPDNSTKVASAPMTEFASGLYEYGVKFTSAWPKGDYSVVCSETTYGTTDAITITLASSDIDSVSNDVSAVMGSLAPIKDIKAQMENFSSAFNLIENNIKQATESLSGMKSGSQDILGTSKMIDTLHKSLKDMSGKIKEMANQVDIKGLEKLYEVQEKGAQNLDYIRNKTQELKAMMLLNQQLMENTAKEEPVVQTWFEYR